MSVVIAGPYDSRSYVIGCYVLYLTQEAYPTFFYQVIPLKTERWKDWLKNKCEEENWNFEDLRREKVLSWFEQCYSGGPKVLLGGLPSLLEYIKDKYQISRDLTADQVAQLIQASTEHWNELEAEEAKNKGSGGNISIVGAGSNEAVSFLLYALMTTKTPVIRTGIKIKLFEATDDRQKQLKKNFDRMSTVETNINICIVDDLLDVFKNCDLLIFLGDKFRTSGMDIERFMYLEKVLYGSYGFLCNYHMEQQTMVMFACMENAAFNATCFLAEAPVIDKRKVVALTSYLGTELKLYISKMAGFPVESLEQIPVWGMADTCHLVDVDMGSLIFRIPDSFNPKYPNIKSLARLIEDDGTREKLYKMWKMQQDKSVAQWRWMKIKENLKIEETKANIRNMRIDALNTLAGCYKEIEKKYGRIPYWGLWDKSMAQLQEGEDYYSPENMYRRFRKGLYQVVQDNSYFENEELKKTQKLEDEYKKLPEKAETLADYLDPLKIGIVDVESIQKFLEEEFFKKEMKMVEEEDVDELCKETKIPKGVRDMENLRRDVYNKRNELKKKIRSYWKKHMEEEIARLENELRRKSLANKEEILEEGWMVEENESRVIEGQSEKGSSSTTTTEPIPEIISEDNYRTAFHGGEERFEETIPHEIKLSEREMLNRMIKDYFRAKMKLERQVKKDLEKDSESSESYRYEEIDDYEIRELGYITGSMKNLWNFIGVCKSAVRKKIGQDPYIAQVHELIRVLKIWFLDPYMTRETVFLGIASDYDVYPFLSDTVMSQPAYCDENFRWLPLKEANHLWPKTPLEKEPDNAESDVPFFKTPRKGLPFTIEYVSGISLECLMHFSIPPASYFETQRKLREYADEKEYYDLAFTTREADKAQLKDLFRRLGQEVESSVEDFVVEEEEEKEDKEEEEEAGMEIETYFEAEMDGEGVEELEEEINPEDLGLEDELAEENEPLRESKPELHEELNQVEVKPDLPAESKIEELDKLGTEEFESTIEEDQFDYEATEDLEDFGRVGEEFKDEYDEDDPLSFLGRYGDDFTIEEFLAIFEKKKDPKKEIHAESEEKPPKRTKSVWKCYLEMIGFYNLDIPEILVAVDPEEMANYEENEKPKNPFESESSEDSENIENCEEILKEEGSEEMSEEISEENSRKKISQKKLEEDPEYQTRGIGFIENPESDFSPTNITEMPYYKRFNKRAGIKIAEKSIHEGHTKKIGYPIHPKGSSQTDMGMALMKMDVGSGMTRTNEKVDLEGFVQEEPYIKREPPKMSPSGILRVHIPPDDDNSGDSTDSYIPDTQIRSEATSGSSSVFDAENKGDQVVALSRKNKKEQEELLMKYKMCSKVAGAGTLPLENFDYFYEMENFGSEHLPKDSIIVHKKKLKRNWVHEIVKVVDSPAKVAALNRGYALASVTNAHPHIKQKQRMNTKKENKPIEKSQKRKVLTEIDEEHQREAWFQGFEKLRRIMELERISGNSYLHLELDEDKDRIKVELAYEQEKRFADWVLSVIDEHEKIQNVRDSVLYSDSNEESQQIADEENSKLGRLHPVKKNRDHHVWINQMIREIIVVDQIYDLENVIRSVRYFSRRLPGDEILKMVTGTNTENSVRYTILEEIGNNLKSIVGESDSDEILEPSDEDISKIEEKIEERHRLPRERELVLRELMKTEKEITKDCHDLASYVQKCRDNTKLYSLYRGDTPQKWRFLNRQPNENMLRFKCKALIHIMLTMSQLQQDFKKEMEELEEKELDFTKVLSDSIGKEELDRYGFMPDGKPKPNAELDRLFAPNAK